MDTIHRRVRRHLCIDINSKVTFNILSESYCVRKVFELTFHGIGEKEFSGQIVK